MRDRLYLLRPGFFVGDKGPFYCGDSLSVEGLVGFFPQLRNMVDIHYIEAARPREVLVGLLGPDNQSIPVLVIGSSNEAPVQVELQSYQGQKFINVPTDICAYLSAAYTLPTPA